MMQWTSVGLKGTGRHTLWVNGLHATLAAEWGYNTHRLHLQTDTATKSNTLHRRNRPSLSMKVMASNSHWIVSRIQNCVKNSPIQTVSQSDLNSCLLRCLPYLPTLTPSYIPSLCGGGKGGDAINTIWLYNLLFLRFLMSTFVLIL